MSEIELTAVKPHQHSNAAGDGGMLHPTNTLISMLNIQSYIVLLSLIMS